jgi:hypothetical protein
VQKGASGIELEMVVYVHAALAVSTGKLKSVMLHISNVKRGKHNIMCEIDNGG